MEDIQRLKDRIDELERENAQLRQENEELKSQARSAPAAAPPMSPVSHAPPKAQTKPAASYKKPAPAPAPAPVHAPPPPAPAPDGEPYKALYSFNGEQAGDLQFKKGDIIYVQKKDGSWWEGTCNGRSGAFPSNYVTKA